MIKFEELGKEIDKIGTDIDTNVKEIHSNVEKEMKKIGKEFDNNIKTVLRVFDPFMN